MATEFTVLEFKISNTFSEYFTHMNDPKQEARFKEMVVKTFCIGECLGDSKRATVMLEGPENLLYNIFTSTKTNHIVEASVHVFEGKKIKRWLNQLFQLLIFRCCSFSRKLI